MRSPGMAHIADFRSYSFHVALRNSTVRTEVGNSRCIAKRVSGVPTADNESSKRLSSSALERPIVALRRERHHVLSQLSSIHSSQTVQTEFLLCVIACSCSCFS